MFSGGLDVAEMDIWGTHSAIIIPHFLPTISQQFSMSEIAFFDNYPCWLKNPPSTLRGCSNPPKAARIGVSSDGPEDTSAEVGQCCLSNAFQTGGVFLKVALDLQSGSPLSYLLPKPPLLPTMHGSWGRSPALHLRLGL